MLDYIVLIPSSLSIFGSLFIILSYSFFIKLRSSIGIFALWLSIAGLGNSLYPFLGSPKNNSYLCIIQSIIGTYFLLVTFFTSTILSKLLYSIFYNIIIPNINIKLNYIIYSWGLPLILISLPLITNSYGKDKKDDRYCWIPSNDGHNHIAVVMQFVVLYGPMWLCIVYDLVAYGLVWKKQKLMLSHINQSLLTSSQNRVMKLSRRMIGYPVVTILSWTIPTILRIGETFGWQSPDILDQIGRITIYIHGFLIFLVYCSTSPCLQIWKQYFISFYSTTVSNQSTTRTSQQTSSLSLRNRTQSNSIDIAPVVPIYHSSMSLEADDSEGNYFHNNSQNRRWTTDIFNFPRVPTNEFPE